MINPPYKAWLRKDGSNADSNVDIGEYDLLADIVSSNCVTTNAISANILKGNVLSQFTGSSTAISRYKPSSGRWHYASSQKISGGSVKSYNTTIVSGGSLNVHSGNKINFRGSDNYIYSNATGELTVLGASQTIIGTAGDIILGDGTERNMYPQTNLCMNLGTTTNKFKTIYCDTLINDDYYPSSLGKNLYNFSSNSKYLYANSSNVGARFPGSSNVNRALLNSISSNLDTRVDSLFNWSSNKGLYYPSTSGRDYAFKHSSNTNIHALSTTNIRVASVSSSRISGQWISPLYTNLNDAGNANTRPGQIIRTSGNADGTWVWISIFGGSTYQWKELSNLSGV